MPQPTNGDLRRTPSVRRARLLCCSLLLSHLLATPGWVGCGPIPLPGHPRSTRLLLVSTNDLHGQLSPLRMRTHETPRRTVRVGGAEALVATVAHLRSKTRGQMLLVDAGDFMQGSMLSNGFEGRPVRALFSALHLSAGVVGNHEFDFGPVGPRSTGGPDPRGALKAWIRRAPFPVLSANLADRRSRPLRWPNLHRSVLIRRAGLRVGLIGLTTRETPVTTHPDNVRDLRFLPYRDMVVSEAAALRRRGAQVVILVAHVGGECAGRAASSCKGDIVRLLRRLPPGTVHAAVAAHSHKCMWNRINGVPVVQACSRGVALGRIEIRVSGGRVQADPLPPLAVCHDVFSDTGGCEAHLRSGAPRGSIVANPLLGRYSSQVSELRSRLDWFRKRLRPRPDRVVGRAGRAMPHYRNRPSPMGLLMAKVLLQAVPGAQVALVNAGGVRAGFARGPITYSDVFRVFPFDNQLAYADLTGKELTRLMDAYLSWPSAGLLLVAGLRYRVRCGPPYRLLELTDDGGHPLDPTRIYRVALSDFLLSGGDRFGRVLSRIPAARKRVLRGRLVRAALLRYLRSRRAPLGAPAQGRSRALVPPILVDGAGCPRPRRRVRLRHICR